MQSYLSTQSVFLCCDCCDCLGKATAVWHGDC